MKINTNILKYVRYTAWTVVALIIAVGLGWVVSQQAPAPAVEQQTLNIGGAFTLVNQFGKTVTEKDFLGKPTMMFFGFASCPSVCPSTLTDMGIWLEKLGNDGNRINAVFISVDPDRDTVPRLAEYLNKFDKRIIALTGTPEQVAVMAKAYKIYYKKVPLDSGDYMVDHSATIYLFDKNGKLVSTIDNNENRDYALAKVKKLVSESK